MSTRRHELTGERGCQARPDGLDRADDFRVCIDGKSSGAVRISVGMVTNFHDVQSFLSFARGLVR